MSEITTLPSVSLSRSSIRPWLRPRLWLATIGALVPVMTSPVKAQRDEKPRITVMTFQSADQGVGSQLADVLRDRLSDELGNQVVTVPTKIVSSTLEASSFSPTEPLGESDEQQLAKLLRADYYVRGVASRTATGYAVWPRLVLSRDVTLEQPLPATTGAKPDAAVAPIAKSVKDALRQLDGEQKCVAALRAGDAQKAIAAARAGTAAYPRATLARLCELNAYWTVLYPKASTRADSLRYADSALVVAQTIQAIDSGSIQPLKAQAELYAVLGDSARSRQALLGLIRADPTNTTLLEQVVNSLAATHHSAEAIPLVRELLAKSPADRQFLRTAFLVYLDAKEWQAATETGLQLVRIDSTAMDSSYFVRMAVAYQQLNQPQQALAILQQGTTKLPSNADLWQLYAQELRKAGQAQQATEALRRSLALNPRSSVGQLQMAEAYMTGNRPDSALASLQQAAAAPDADKSTVAQVAFAQGGRLYKTAVASKQRADYQQAIRFLQFSNQVSPSVDAQFLLAASHFAVMQSAAQEANETKSCELARLAQQSYGEVPAGIEAGKRDPKYQAGAAQMAEALPQFRDAIADEVKRFCK